MGRVIRELWLASIATKSFLKLEPAGDFWGLPWKIIGCYWGSSWKSRDETTHAILRLVGQAGLWIGVCVCTVAALSQPCWSVFPSAVNVFTSIWQHVCQLHVSVACFIICSTGITILYAHNFYQIKTHLKFQCLTTFWVIEYVENVFLSQQHIFQIQNS